MTAPLTLILGPTASGKSAVAIKLAKQTGAHILSADAFQVYRGLDIGTGKLTVVEQEGIPHYLIDIKSPLESYSVAEFLLQTESHIKTLSAAGIPLIICGGTAFYLYAFLNQLQFQELPIDPELRQRLQESWSHRPEEAWQYLHQIDPATAAQVPATQIRRILRAIEVFEQTKIPFSKQQSQPTPRTDCRVLGLCPERPELIARIHARIDTMFEAGWIDEVIRLRQEGVPDDAPAFEAIGYREIIQYLQGDVELETMIEWVKARTRQFSKRQMTWFRRFQHVEWTLSSNV